MLPTDRDFPTAPHLKSFAHLYGAFHGSQTDLQQGRQAGSPHSHCIGISQSGSSMSLFIAQLETEADLGLLSFHIRNKGQHHLPLAA